MSAYAMIRSGILDYVLRREIGYSELGVYTAIHLQADFSTGIWWGSAPRLQGGTRDSLRDVQRWLQRLKEIGFIRPFHEHGARGNYPVLINKYEVKIGALKGKRLNAWKSESCENPCYEVCADAVADAVAEAVAEAAPYQYAVSSKQEKPRAAKTAAPPDNRFKRIIEAYYDCQKKAGIEPGCDKSDFGALQAWLKRNPVRSVDSIAASLRNAIASTDQFPLRPGFRLREFLEHESKYQLGPLLRAAPKVVQKTAVPAKNELSPDGRAKIAAYMGSAS